jgi:hypothetical protein
MVWAVIAGCAIFDLGGCACRRVLKVYREQCNQTLAISTAPSISCAAQGI